MIGFFSTVYLRVQVEVTKFDALEETHAELKLKDMLWNAIDEWDGLMSEWTTVSVC